jgi:hypothetical protein
MAPPSCLPDWRAFNSLVLDEARASALAVLPDLEADTRRELEELSLEALPVVAFSETLVRTFAGDTWFPVLGVLDGDLEFRDSRGEGGPGAACGARCTGSSAASVIISSWSSAHATPPASADPGAS